MELPSFENIGPSEQIYSSNGSVHGASATLIAGAAITETIFSWPGIGSMFVESVGNRDYPVIMAVAMLSGIAVIVGNLVPDVLYGMVEPRIKY